jgi:hypothetical protein
MRWGVRAALRGQLAPGDEIRAMARDEISRDYWVVTDGEVIRMHGRSVAQRMPLTEAIGAVTVQPPAGVTIRIHSRRDSENRMLTSFRKPNGVTRRLAEVFDTPSSG